METGSKQKLFFDILKKHKILLNKSQLPTIKAAKDAAMKDFQTEIMKCCGVEMTAAQIKKRVQNMKNEVKKKSDIKVTGNRPIILKDWEKEFLELMDFESNPSFAKVPGFCDIGTEDKPLEINLCQENADSEGYTPDKKKFKSPKEDFTPIKSKLKTSKPLTDETEETKSLTTSELQRLVLLEQLKLVRLQIAKETAKKSEENLLDRIFEA